MNFTNRYLLSLYLKANGILSLLNITINIPLILKKKILMKKEILTLQKADEIDTIYFCVTYHYFVGCCCRKRKQIINSYKVVAALLSFWIVVAGFGIK